MKIAVLVKQVPDLEATVEIASDKDLRIEDRYVCSFFDEIAMEAALAVKAAAPDAQLTAFSAGGRRAVDALRRAVAMGIDQVEHLGDETLDGADSLVVASVLASRLKAFGPSLVLAGKQAGDDDMAAVGPMVAALLGMPHASAVVSLKVDAAAGTVEVGREVEGEVWTLKAPLPALVTAEKGLAEPRIPVVTRVMKAMKAKIPNVPLTELGVAAPIPGARTRHVRYAPPPSRPAVTMLTEPFPANVDELARRLEQAGVLA
ncbi:MAG: electron transfer flavoprotein subunit beta/FixA family protein [Deltaproteobacteria bacterium]|nr:electron transfer flavoprotein subunit beta/FixA family protein [Deltaproteobacteria bacterium]